MSMGQKREHRGWKNEFCQGSRLWGVSESIKEEVGGEIEWGQASKVISKEEEWIYLYMCVCVYLCL